MVVKRQCSFCASEIEPGTGMMFVKRDGTVFHFCSSSCRKQQLHLGRVGHRFKWTRAHELKRAADRSSAAARSEGRASASAPKGRPATPVPAPEPAATPAPPPPEATVAEAKPEPAAAPDETSKAPAAKPKAKPRKKAPAPASDAK